MSLTPEKLSDYMAVGPFNVVVAMGLLVHFNDEDRKCDILENIIGMLFEDVKSRAWRIPQCFLELKQTIPWQKVVLLTIEQVIGFGQSKTNFSRFDL